MRPRSPSSDPASRLRLARVLPPVLLFLVLVVVGAEVGVRLVRNPEYRRPISPQDGTLWKNIVHRRSEIPGLDYELKPLVHRTVNEMEITTNSLGMRGPEPLARREPGDVRIAAVGDSLTFGMRVSGNEAWPAALEAKIAAAPVDSVIPGARRVEVLNLGVSGYGTLDEAIVVREKAMPLDPDLVILGYYLNDPETEPVQQLHQHFRTPVWWEHSALLRLLRFEKRTWDQERYGGGDPFRYLHRDPETWQSVLDGFADIAQATAGSTGSSTHALKSRSTTTDPDDAAGPRVLLVVLPTLRGVERFEDYPYADLHRQVIEAGKVAGFETLDVLPTWIASGRSPAELQIDGEHPNALGQALVADAILAKLAACPTLVRDRRVAAATGSGSRPPSK